MLDGGGRGGVGERRGVAGHAGEFDAGEGFDFFDELAVDGEGEAEPGEDVGVGGVERHDDEDVELALEVGEAAVLWQVLRGGLADEEAEGAGVFVVHAAFAAGLQRAVEVVEGDDGRAGAGGVADEEGGERGGVAVVEQLLDRGVAGHDLGGEGEELEALLDGGIDDAGGAVEVGAGVFDGVGVVGAGDDGVGGGERGEEQAEQEREHAQAEAAEAEGVGEHGGPARRGGAGCYL